MNPNYIHYIYYIRPLVRYNSTAISLDVIKRKKDENLVIK